MKQLLPLILICALLCGCGHSDPSEETVPPLPTESVAGEVTEPEEYGGAVRTVPLNLQKVRGLRVFHGSLLLFSGQGSTTLTLLDGASLAESASLTLNFQLEQGDPSLQFHPEGTLSFFDPGARETVVLNSALQEVRRIPAPGALSGTPILSGDGKTLFYCTASHVRAWELDSGIHRCVKEMAFSGQSLSGVLMDGSILQCRVTEGEEVHTLFLSAVDGRLLHRGDGQYTLMEDGGCYYAAVPAGAYRVLVFGTDPAAPCMLAPADLGAQAFFLPGQQAAVTASSLADDRVRLDYYVLSTGLRTHQLTLGAYQLPRSAVCLGKDRLALLTYDPALDQELLILWTLRENSPLAVQEDICYTGIYHAAGSPDTAGLAQCRQQADRLGSQYGLRILLWEEASAAEPPGYDLEPEHLVPVLQQELALLEQRLAHYPETMLRDTAAHFSSLNLCLVRSLQGSAAGGTEVSEGVQFLDESDAYMVIAAGPSSGQALYHTLCHLMETHIFSESKAFDRWDELNPAGFQYDYDYAANAVRDSGVYLFEDSRAFVDTFSMSYPKEDRARIMEYAMLPGYEDLFRPRQMQAKLRQLCTGIREAYQLEDREEDFLWEQYLE